MLKEVAEKRLQAIKEFTELGSGFKIAMRDLEIRGAGNLLGAQQSGHMEAVGYDLYCKMLNDAVRSMKGEIKEEETFDTTVDMDIDAYIPSTYIKSEFQKLDVYKRIAEIENEEELLDMQEELLDRFGDMPSSVNNLLNIAYIKSICHSVYITSLVYRNDEIKLVLYKEAKLKVEKFPELIEKHQPSLKLYPEANPYFIYSVKKNWKTAKLDVISLFELVKNLLSDLKLLLAEE
jgi:transcription-repair coupling factor (superfamily II helicase)